MDQVQPLTVPITLSSHNSHNFDHWREDSIRRIFRADVETAEPARYRSRLRLLPLPKISVVEGRCTPSILNRTKPLTRDGDDGLVVHMPWRQSLAFRARDGDGQVEAGQMIMLPLNEPTSLVAADGIYGVSLRIDRQVARALFRDAEYHLRRPLPVAADAARLLRGYFLSLLALREGLSPALAEIVDLHVQELLASAFDPLGELARAAPYGGVRAARLQAVMQEIAQRLADPDLSAVSVGQRLGVSERYVQQLMEGTGTSFSALVRQRRLDKARDLLRDPAMAHLRIVDVAGMTGLGDVSHFNREFRRRFGETPRDTRRRNS